MSELKRFSSISQWIVISHHCLKLDCAFNDSLYIAKNTNMSYLQIYKLIHKFLQTRKITYIWIYFQRCTVPSPPHVLWHKNDRAKHRWPHCSPSPWDALPKAIRLFRSTSLSSWRILLVATWPSWRRKSEANSKYGQAALSSFLRLVAARSRIIMVSW